MNEEYILVPTQQGYMVNGTPFKIDWASFSPNPWEDSQTKPKPKKPKKKIKKDYVVGDRIEAVRQFGNTGITEGHKGTIVKIYEGTERPLIVQWDDHEKSHIKEWNYPFKDVRPFTWEPGEATDDQLF
jgi:hypothetical protein